MVPRQRFRIRIRLAADPGLVPQDRISLFAVRGQQRHERAVDRLRSRHPRDWRCAQLAEGDAVHLDRTGLAFQLARPLLIVAKLRRQKPGAKAPGFLFGARLATTWRTWRT